MHWITGLIGAFFGASLAEAGTAFLGAIVGMVLGWHFGRHVKWSARLKAVEDKLARLEGRAAAEAVRAAAEPAPVRPPAAEAAPAPVAATETPIPQPDLAPVAASEAVTPRMSERVVPDAAAAPPPPPPPAPGVAATAADAPPPLFQPSPWQRPPHVPSSLDRFVGSIKSWFTEGNVPVKVGVVVLFFGVAALIKYAVDQEWLTLPIEVRMAGIAAAGVAALVFGWRQRSARRVFGLALQGGALGVLLLTVFASFRLYHLITPMAAFVLIGIVVAGAALLAVLQDALALAVLGFVGGFLGPVLIQTGSADHVALFSYYAVLNLAIFVVAWIRPWRALNLVGFGFTFVVGLAWGREFYRPELFASVEPFLVAFFLFYVAIAVLYALRAPDDRRGFVDSTLVFGTPLLAFPLQAAMVDDRMLLAYSALAVGALYAFLFVWLRRRERLETLALSYAALSVGFLTLAVPLALSARWTSGAWALEGAALVWLGLRQQRRLPIAVGGLLQLAAGFSLWFAFIDQSGASVAEGEMAIVNGWCFGALILAFAGLFCARRLDMAGAPVGFSRLLFLWAWAWWIWAGVREIDAHAANADIGNWLVGFTVLTMLGAGWAWRRFQWPPYQWPVLLGFALGPVLALLTQALNGATLEANGWLAWLFWLAGAWSVLALVREPRMRGLAFAHVFYLATLALVLGLEGEYLARVTFALGDGWRVTLAVVPLLALTLGTFRVPALAAAPLAAEFEGYRRGWFVLALMALMAWWLVSLANDGGAYPLGYLPLLNPVELCEIGALLLVLALVRAGIVAPEPTNRRALQVILIGAGFVTLTIATLRGVHHYGPAPWSPAILDSMLAQASLTVVWSLAGMAAWITGSKRLSRPLWLAGAVLMAIVLAKLILVDRRYTGDLPGIVSFFAFGILCLIVGYIAPSPPKQAAAEEPT